MNKQDVIISLLKEIDKNIDNVNDSGCTNANLKELTVTANGEYLPADYNVDGFSKVVAQVVPTKRAVLSKMPIINNNCIVDGYWAGELVDVSLISNFAGIFATCSNLKIIDVSNWDTSNATAMNSMFRFCSQLQSLDVSNWNTSKVTNMFGMFEGCTSLQSLDVSNWNTSKVTECPRLFHTCFELQSLDVSRWDVSNINNITDIFYRCGKLQKLDLSNWNVSNVLATNDTFVGCGSLQSLIGNRTIDEVIANNVGALNGLKVSLHVNGLPLDRASLRALINGLADLTGQNAQTLFFGNTLIAKLTEEDIAIATAKNWTIV